MGPVTDSLSGFVPVPAAPEVVGAYLASLADTYSPATIRRRLSALAKMHPLRVGFITEAYAKGVRDQDIMRHTWHRDLRTMRGYVRRAGLLTESPAGMLDL